MCAICGIVEPGRETPIEVHAIQAMADTMSHRGPDDEGFYTAPGVGLGHRRLSIIDVSGGHQPLSNEDGSIWVVFNGEIYNFEELNQRYLSSGHHFRTRCDTETIVHLYEELGEACFSEMRGMFAIALWDDRRKKLLLARDRLGKKPVYYSWNGKRLVFASELKAIRAAGGSAGKIDLEAVSDYFSLQYIPAPKTIYTDVRKLPAGHYLVLEGHSIREVCYWDIRFDQTEDLSEQQWIERFLEEFRTAVKLRLISDVPLGAFLSGGVDSSAVVAFMHALQPPVTTCSIGFPEASYNEAADAKRFATGLGANHFEHVVQPQAIEILPKLAWHYDEPFADSSAVPTYYVSKIARQHVTVVLSGDGGDENFAGYGRYRMTLWEHQLRSWFPPAVRARIFGPLGELYPPIRWAPRIFRAKSTLQSLARSTIDGYFHSMSICPPRLKQQLLSGDVQQKLNGYDSAEVLRQHYRKACEQTQDELSRIQYVDIKTYLVDDILTKVDRASMANSLEVRCPLLDYKLMELIARIPSSLKLRHGRGKYIFKKALEGILPAEILTRRKKGFAVPVETWFRRELKDIAYEKLFRAPEDLFHKAFLTRCWNQHQSGQRDWSPLFWSILMFRTWQEIHHAR